jgi:tetratricopeptide (TPR) repeat protein
VQIDLPRGGYVPRVSWRDETSAGATLVAVERVELAPGNGMPTLRVAPFAVAGTPDTPVITTERLASRIADAFALFDVINVIPPSTAPAGYYDYRLDGTIEYRGNETVDLRFKLVDEADGTVIWSRALEKLSGAEDGGAIERNVILELATAVVQPYSVISSNDRAKRFAGDTLDPRYRALIDAADALRTFDPVTHVRARDRLEELTAIDPNFANGFSLLAGFYVREYLTGLGARPGDPPALDRALKAARRGVELKPQSARAYHLLFSVLFSRGEKDAAIAAAEKAMALNPYDLLIMAEYGGRLIYCGEVDRGLSILHDSVGRSGVLLAWSHFAMFVGHYVRGQLAEARYHASQLTNETYAYGQLARALIAQADGDSAEARRAVQALLTLQPSWREDARREIGKLVNAAALADRLAGDLLATGYLP